MTEPAAITLEDPVARLDKMLAGGLLNSTDADRCAELLEALSRPARVCLLGTDRAAIGSLLGELVGHWIYDTDEWPAAVEFTYEMVPRVVARLEDGSSLTHHAWPARDVLQQQPVFLQISLPVDQLRDISVLALQLDNDPQAFRPAMKWAAKRSELAVWCTPHFGANDARIWSCAPDRLNQHAFLFETCSSSRAEPKASTLSFMHVFSIFDAKHDPASSFNTNAKRLGERLRETIEEARNADLDLAQLFLHRVALVRREPENAVSIARPGTQQATRSCSEIMRPLVSEPLIYLMRRARMLSEDLVWADPSEDWASEVLTHCHETTEALRIRVSAWPDDDPQAVQLQELIEMACDTTALLQIESGPESAEDAATIMIQLRMALVQAIAPDA